MNDRITIETEDMNFKDFLFKNKVNRITLWLAIAAVMIQFAIFKYLYPYANFIHGDSFSYINAAYQNLSINKYLIGYSKFLRLFSVFSTSDIVLVAFQYLAVQFSILFLLFTLFYFHTPARITQYLLLGFVLLNPLSLHLANLISSDCIFAAVSFIWFTQLLWIIHRPSTLIIMLQACVLFLAFIIRYNGLIYLFITLIAFGLTTISLRIKVVGIITSIFFISLFVWFSSNQYKKLTGHWQYSPFSGWQLANNAMYAYRYVHPFEREPVPAKYRTLDNMIRQFFDSTHDAKKFPTEQEMASTYYMWSSGMPLIRYETDIYKNDNASSDLKKWASMGPFFKQYGLYIIRKYPWHFIRFFIWPNSQKYYAPPTEFLSVYNSGKDTVLKIAQTWFGYKSRNVTTRMKTKEVVVLEFLPILSGIINIALLCCLICYVSLKGWRYKTFFTKAIILGATFWLLNACFTIGASSAALRFQSFPIILTTTFVFLLVDWMIDLMKITASTKKEIGKPREKFSPKIA